MPKPKTVSHVVEVDRVEDLRNLPKNVNEAVVNGIKYKRHESYDGGTYWAAKDVNIPKSAEIQIHKDVIIGPKVELSEGIDSEGIKIGMGSTIGAGTKIGPGTAIGESVNIGENCEIGEEVVIGNEVKLSKGIKIGMQTTIDSDSKIGPGTAIGESVNIGENCEIGIGKKVVTDENKVVIGDGVQIDDHVIIENGSRIGDRAYIGKNATIKEDSKMGEEGRVEPGEYYHKTDPERKEEKYLRKEFKEDLKLFKR